MQSDRCKITKLKNLLWAVPLCLCISIPLSSQAFEDCVVSTNGKLSDISIEDNSLVDVYPIFTIMNEKNTLYVHPLKTGKTRFCVLKNGKEIVMFNVEVNEDNTVIDEIEGFEIFSVDMPPEELYLDNRLTPHPNPLSEEREYSLELDLPPGGN